MTRPAARRRWLLRLLGPLLLGIILLRLDLGEVAAALEGVWVLPVAGACLAVLPTVPLRSWRWRILVAASGTRLGAVEALNAYAFSIVVGAATPGRLGELIKIGYLRNKRVPTTVAVLSVGLDRLLDVAFLATVGAGALAAHLVGRSAAVVVTAMFGAAVLGVAALSYAVSSHGRRAAGDLVSRLLPLALSRWIRPAMASLFFRSRSWAWVPATFPSSRSSRHTAWPRRERSRCPLCISASPCGSSSLARTP